MRQIIEAVLGRKDDIQIIGYDSKMDLRRMTFFLSKTQVMADEEVMSLF